MGRRSASRSIRAKAGMRSAACGSWISTASIAARSPTRRGSRFGRPDGKTIGYLLQEFPKFNVMDYYTKGMVFYNLESGKSEPHVKHAALHHLYNPSYAPNGKWIAATVHAGMGFSHAILLIEAHGPRIINLKIPGCRPCLSPDGRHIAWGAGDHELGPGADRPGLRAAVRGGLVAAPQG